MSAGEYCNRDVVIVESSEPIQTAVDLMRKHHVGDVVVVNKENGSTRPIGIIVWRKHISSRDFRHNKYILPHFS